MGIILHDFNGLNVRFGSDFGCFGEVSGTFPEELPILVYTHDHL